MHKRPEAELLPMDTKSERTLRNLKKLRVAKEIAMENKEGTNHHIPVKATTKRLHR